MRFRLIAALCGLFAALGLSAGVGWYASNTAKDGMDAVYADRVVPLRDLKVVADMYAVDIVDTAHKVRVGSLPMSAGVDTIRNAQAQIASKWAEYDATRMDARERRLADETRSAMTAASTTASDLIKTLRDIHGIVCFATIYTDPSSSQQVSFGTTLLCLRFTAAMIVQMQLVGCGWVACGH